MIKITNTENLAGVTISGEFSDLEALVDAFYEIAIDEYNPKTATYASASNRMLAVCYEVRHAFQGDREAFLVENYLTPEKKQRFSILTSDKNLHYSCNVLYTDMLFCTLVVNELIRLRMLSLCKKDQYNYALNKNVIWDSTIATLRSFQAEFARCVKNTVSEATYKRWLTIMNSDYIGICHMTIHYLDIITNDYISMNKEKRLKNLALITKKIANFRNEIGHSIIKAQVNAAMAEYGCAEDQLSLKENDYDEDEEFIW